MDGISFACYNATQGNYNTNLTGLGINITYLQRALDDSTTPYQYTILPTIEPTKPNFNVESNSQKELLSLGAVIGIAFGGFAVLIGISYIAYSYGFNIFYYPNLATENLSKIAPDADEAILGAEIIYEPEEMVYQVIGDILEQALENV